MDWPEPEYSKNQVNKAGRILVTPATPQRDRRQALVVVNNWRSSHSFPLNTQQIRLRRVASRYDADLLVAQRLKRLPSIEAKLHRISWMKLGAMQDLGGARAIVRDVETVRAVHKGLLGDRSRHHLSREDDYIEEPRPTGYRGVHLVFAYESDQNSTYNGHKIEMQIRSRHQHTWATAVETVGTFINQALKSSQGDVHWLRFFALMGSEIAFLENCTPVPNTPTAQKQVRGELQALATKIDALNRLDIYGQAVQVLETAVTKGDYYLLQLDIKKGELLVDTYTRKDLEQATKRYGELEQHYASDNVDVVLVRADSVDGLRRAYPNYFADTGAFIDLLGLSIAA